MQTKLAEADQMTVAEFLAFYDSRPSGEKWELIEGQPIMSPSPTDWHQRIVQNIGNALDSSKLTSGAAWIAVPGIGTRVPLSPNSLPQPDVLVKEGALIGAAITDEAIVLFEVLSRSNSAADRAWRKRVYASVPNCQHYVTISTKSSEAVRHDRADGWKGTTFKGRDATLSLPAIDVGIRLSDIYRWTSIE